MATTMHVDAATNATKQPGGAIPHQQRPQTATATPEIVKYNQRSGTRAGYKAECQRDGIPFRPHGLFDEDELLLRLSATPNCWPFEKHLPGPVSPYERLPQGGWITGDAAAAHRGIDLRLFYQEPDLQQENGSSGKIVGAVRFGEGAAIGVGFHLSAHGGAIETVLDEATAELGKIEFAPFLSTREATFSIRKPVPLHTTLAVKCKVTQRKGIRCWVEGSIEVVAANDGDIEGSGEILATCQAQLVDMTHFIK